MSVLTSATKYASRGLASTLASLAVLASVCVTADAATFYWQGTGTNPSTSWTGTSAWSTFSTGTWAYGSSGTWSPASAAGAGDDVVLWKLGTGGGFNAAIYPGASASVRSITMTGSAALNASFASNATSGSSAIFTIGSGGITKSATGGALTLGASNDLGFLVRLGASQTWQTSTAAVGNGISVQGAGVDLNGNNLTLQALGAGSNGGITVKRISGTGNVTIDNSLSLSSPARVLFSGTVDNTFSGTTTVTSGSLVISKSAPVRYISIPGPLVIGNNTDPAGRANVVAAGLNPFADTTAVTLNSSGVLYSGSQQLRFATITGSGEWKLRGDASSPDLYMQRVGDSSNFTFSGRISGSMAPDIDANAWGLGGWVTKLGSGTMSLAGATGQVGAIWIKEGAVANPNLLLGGFRLYANTSLVGGTVTLAGNQLFGGGLVWNPDGVDGFKTTISSVLQSADPLEDSVGVIEDAPLTISTYEPNAPVRSGTVVLTGQSTFTGNLNLTWGLLEIPTFNSRTEAGPLGKGTLVIGSGIYSDYNKFGTIRLTGTNAQYTAVRNMVVCTQSGSGRLDQAGGGVLDIANAGTTLTLSGTFQQANGQDSYANGVGILRKTGAGTLVLSGTDNLLNQGVDSWLVVDQGTLKPDNKLGLGRAGGKVGVEGSGVLDVAGLSIFTQGISLSGSGMLVNSSATPAQLGGFSLNVQNLGNNYGSLPAVSVSGIDATFSVPNGLALTKDSLTISGGRNWAVGDTFAVISSSGSQGYSSSYIYVQGVDGTGAVTSWTFSNYVGGTNSLLWSGTGYSDANMENGQAMLSGNPTSAGFDFDLPTVTYNPGRLALSNLIINSQGDNGWYGTSAPTVTIAGGGAGGADGNASVTTSVPVMTIAASTSMQLGGVGDLSIPYAITGAVDSGLTKIGAGKLTVTGTSTYGGVTAVTAGRLSVNGDISASSQVAVSAGSVLQGSGKVSTIAGDGSGGGLVSPGNSPGILTAVQTDPTGQGTLSYAFEMTGVGSPTWSSGTASINDVLRLTDATTPFVNPLGAGNTINVYFNLSSLSGGEVFRGGFFTDKNSDFTTSVDNATYVYYAYDSSGTTTFQGVSYSLLGSKYPSLSSVTRSVVQVGSANYSSGTVTNGWVQQFAIVPEPGSIVLLASGAGLLAWRRARRSRG